MSEEKRRLTCGVVHDRYKSCVAAALPRVVTHADPTAPTRMCASLYAHLTEMCSDYMRTGELATGKPVTDATR